MPSSEARASDVAAIGHLAVEHRARRTRRAASSLAHSGARERSTSSASRVETIRRVSVAERLAAAGAEAKLADDRVGDPQLERLDVAARRRAASPPRPRTTRRPRAPRSSGRSGRRWRRAPRPAARATAGRPAPDSIASESSLEAGLTLCRRFACRLLAGHRPKSSPRAGRHRASRRRRRRPPRGRSVEDVRDLVPVVDDRDADREPDRDAARRARRARATPAVAFSQPRAERADRGRQDQGREGEQADQAGAAEAGSTRCRWLRPRASEGSIVPQVGDDHRDDRAQGEGRDAEGPPAGDVAEVVDAQVDAAEPDRDREQRARRRSAPSRRCSPAAAARSTVEREPCVDDRVGGVAARIGRSARCATSAAAGTRPVDHLLEHRVGEVADRERRRPAPHISRRWPRASEPAPATSADHQRDPGRAERGDELRDARSASRPAGSRRRRSPSRSPAVGPGSPATISA